MNVTPELLTLSKNILDIHGHRDAMPDDPGSIAQLTVALRSLLSAVTADVLAARQGNPAARQNHEFDRLDAYTEGPSDSVPKWESDPENFSRIEIRDAEGNVIGGGSLFRGATPSTSAGRYEYNRRREVLKRAHFRVLRCESHRWDQHEYTVPADGLISDVSKRYLIEMRESWLSTGKHPEAMTVKALGTTFIMTMVFDDPTDVKER